MIAAVSAQGPVHRRVNMGSRPHTALMEPILGGWRGAVPARRRPNRRFSSSHPSPTRIRPQRSMPATGWTTCANPFRFRPGGGDQPSGAGVRRDQPHPTMTHSHREPGSRRGPAPPGDGGRDPQTRDDDETLFFHTQVAALGGTAARADGGVTCAVLPPTPGNTPGTGSSPTTRRGGRVAAEAERCSATTACWPNAAALTWQQARLAPSPSHLAVTGARRRVGAGSWCCRRWTAAARPVVDAHRRQVREPDRRRPAPGWSRWSPTANSSPISSAQAATAPGIARSARERADRPTRTPGNAAGGRTYRQRGRLRWVVWTPPGRLMISSGEWGVEGQPFPVVDLGAPVIPGGLVAAVEIRSRRWSPCWMRPSMSHAWPTTPTARGC